MNIDEAVARFENRSKQLATQAWLFLCLVLILLLFGALAVIYAPNLTAGDIGARTIDAKIAALQKEREKIEKRVNEIKEGTLKECASTLESILLKWNAVQRSGKPVEIAFSGDPANRILMAVDEAFASERDPGNTPKEFLILAADCGGRFHFGLEVSQLPEFRAAMSSKSLKVQDAVRELQSLRERSDAVDAIYSQLGLEKVQTEVGILKTDSSSKSENDLFLRLLQTSVTRFGLLAVVGFFVSILVSLYRYNVRLAAFYIARADTLRLFGPTVAVSDFVLITASLSPSLEFGKAPAPPIGQLVDLVKTAKDSAK